MTSSAEAETIPCRRRHGPPAGRLGCPRRSLGVRAVGRSHPAYRCGDQRRPRCIRRRRTRGTAYNQRTQVIEADGRYLVPGLLDAHMHVESGMVTITEFVRAVAPHGTTGIFIDPHEMANVFGLRGCTADGGRGGQDSPSTSGCRCLPAFRPRRGSRRRILDRTSGGGGGHDLAGHHRPGRDDEFPRGGAGDRKMLAEMSTHPRRAQNGGRALRLAGPWAAVPRLRRRAAPRTTTKERAWRTRLRECGRA